MGVLHQSRGKGYAASRVLEGMTTASRVANRLDESAEFELMHDVAQRPQFGGLTGALGVTSAGVPIQAKMMVGEAGDRYEQEADRLAPLIVRQINAPGFGEELQDSQAEIQEDAPPKQLQALRPTLQLKGESTGGTVSPAIESAIVSARGGGQPLEAGLKEQFGQVMGRNFSAVRVHTNAQANSLNEALNSQAFTTRQNMFFREGAYQPESREGRELIAHELTHIVQQSACPNRLAGEKNKTSICNPLDTIQRFLTREVIGTDVYEECKPVYDKAKSKGEKNLNTLNKKRNEVKDLDLNIMQKFEKDRNSEIEAKINGHYKNTVKKLGETAKDIYYEVLTENKDARYVASNYYENIFGIPSGSVQASKNFHSTIDGERPEWVPANSDVLWYQYHEAVQAYEDEMKRKSSSELLSKIERHWIENEETKKVITMIAEGYPEADKPQIVERNSDDWKALLGTPNGNSSIWLLHDHMAAYKDAEIQDIELYGDEEAMFWHYNMLIPIR